MEFAVQMTCQRCVDDIKRKLDGVSGNKYYNKMISMGHGLIDLLCSWVWTPQERDRKQAARGNAYFSVVFHLKVIISFNISLFCWRFTFAVGVLWIHVLLSWKVVLCIFAWYVIALADGVLNWNLFSSPTAFMNNSVSKLKYTKGYNITINIPVSLWLISPLSLVVVRLTLAHWLDITKNHALWIIQIKIEC